MNRYYYTVASLPMLFYDEAPSVSRSTFLDICGTELAAEDYVLLERASIYDLEQRNPTSAALEAWRNWERSLRNRLAVLRAETKGEEPEKYLREGPDVFGTGQTAREAAGEDSPLAAEDILNRARWFLLDDLGTGHYFDMEKLVVYFLKLQLLDRKALFDKEKGTAKFGKVIQDLSG